MAPLALLDENVKSLPGASRALCVSFAVSAIEAILIFGQAITLATALTGLWEGIGLETIAGWAIAFALLFSARQLVQFGRDSYMDGYARATASQLRNRMSESLYELGAGAVQRHGSGSLATTLVEGIDQVRNYLALTLPKLTDLMVIPTLLSIALLALDPISGIIAIVILPCIVFYMRLLGSFAKENAAAQHGKYQRMSNHFVDSLKGVATLKAFGRGKAYASSIYKVSERFREATVKTLKTATLSSLVLDLFRVFALAAVAIMFGFRLMAGDAQLMPALAVLIIVPEYFAAVRRFSSDFHASLDGRNQLAAILGVMAEATAAKNKKLPGIGISKNTLELERFTFSYPDAPAAALANINLSIDLPGSAKMQGMPLRIGIIGSSGSGKSTLARILAGFEGGALACPEWRRRVAYIPQNPHIFHGTLRENIAFYCPDASDSQVESAASSAGLSSLVSTLPQGLDTVIGEAGRSLSGGQAQRVALARSFLDAKRDVLILDEPTAHLDIETELDLKKTMLPLMEGKLVFLATHRLHWMRDMDLVLVLENGKVVESGSFEELSSKDGSFTKLASQMRGEVRSQ